jgi:hypothetical protein
MLLAEAMLRPALAESWAAQADVDGNPEQGWNRTTQGADGA